MPNPDCTAIPPIAKPDSPSTRVLNVTVSSRLFRMEAVRVACLSTSDAEASIVASSPEAIEVRLAWHRPDVGPASVRAAFLDAVLKASVDRLALDDDREVAARFANSAELVSTAQHAQLADALRAVQQACDADSPNDEVAQQVESKIAIAADGSGCLITLRESDALVQLDSLRYLLPVVLWAKKQLAEAMQIAIDARYSGEMIVRIVPSAPIGIAEAANRFCGAILPWRLPLPGEPGPEWGEASGLDHANGPADDHPLRPSDGHPVTHFLTQYGQWPGCVHPYRLGEIFTGALRGGAYLVSTRHRAWAILTPADYRRLLSLRIHEDSHLFGVCESLGLILTERNLPAMAGLHAKRYLFMHRPPSLFIMVPTNRCNLACTYCHAEAETSGDSTLDMDDETARKAVDFFMSVPRSEQDRAMSIEFQGGECLLKWPLIQRTMDYAMERAAALGRTVRFCLCTNLTVLSAPIIDEIKRRGNISISSSLDGPAEIHDRQRCACNGGGTYDRVIRAFHTINAKGGVPAGFIATITKNHVGKEAEFVDEYWAQQQRTVYLKYVSQVGRAFTERDTIGLTPKEYQGVWGNALAHIREMNERGDYIRERWTKDVVCTLIKPDYAYMCMRRPCGAGISQVVVDHRGDLYACDQARSIPLLKLGSVRTHTYDDCYTSDSARILRTMSAEVTPECRSCVLGPFCGYCTCRGIHQHGTPRPAMPVDSECETNRRIMPEIWRDLCTPNRAAVYLRWAHDTLKQ